MDQHLLISELVVVPGRNLGVLLGRLLGYVWVELGYSRDRVISLRFAFRQDRDVGRLQHRRPTLPGFIIPLGSMSCFILSMSSTVPLPSSLSRYCFFPMPTECSPVQVPPCAMARSTSLCPAASILAKSSSFSTSWSESVPTHQLEVGWGNVYG